MVEVDPIILLAGTVVVGVVTVMSCMRGPKKAKEVVSAPEKPVTAPSVPVAAVKPKKKSKPKSKSKSATVTEQVAETKQVEVPVVAVAPVEVPVLEPEVSAPVEEEDKIDDMFVVNAAAKRSKKSKESQEQKVARAEKQKVVTKVVKAEDDDEIFAQINAATYSSARDHYSNSQSSGNAPAFDGWAVVEDKRKLKVKKNESANELDEIPALTPAAPPVLAGALSMVEEVSTPPVPIDSVTKEITVEAKKLGLLIGPKGVTKIGLQHATGTEISMPKVEKDHTGPVQIVVTGTAEGVDRAIFALNEFVAKGYCALLSAPDFHEGYVEVKPKFLPDIIGKGGASIKAIQAHTGVKISTPSGYTKTTPSGEVITPSKVKIILAGSKDKVALARSLILDLTKYYHTPVTHPGICHVELDIPSHYYNYIIGSKGSEIKHIQANYKVTVYIPNADSAIPNLLIVGEEANVLTAEKHVHRLIEKVDTQAAERAKAEAEGVALGESARAKFAAMSGAAGGAAAGAHGGSGSRDPRRDKDGAGGRGARPPRNEKEAAARAAETAAQAEKDKEEEWMNEFAPRRAPINLGGMLPATAKFAAAPPALEKPKPEGAANAAAQEGSEDAAGSWAGLTVPLPATKAW